MSKYGINLHLSQGDLSSAIEESMLKTQLSWCLIHMRPAFFPIYVLDGSIQGLAMGLSTWTTNAP